MQRRDLFLLHPSTPCFIASRKPPVRRIFILSSNCAANNSGGISLSFRENPGSLENRARWTYPTGNVAKKLGEGSELPDIN